MFKGVVTETEAVDRFNERILGMMREYDIPMSEALWWDFEGFSYDVKIIFENGGWPAIESEFTKYLRQNLIGTQKNLTFYRDVFTGKSKDLAIKEKKHDF